MTKKRIPTPELSGGYVNIYKPSGSVYLGPDTASYRNGEFYADWITNDFSVYAHGGRWYMTGITHPRPEGFSDGFKYVPGTVHEAEYQLFLCEAEGETFADVFRGGAFSDREKLLWPSERPDERPELHAPHLFREGDLWKLVYGPCELRMAESEGFSGWRRRVLFTDEGSARDPFLYRENGLWRLLYAVADRVAFRTSLDLEVWSEAAVLQRNPFKNGASESPFLLKREGYYYLFWTLFDGRNGSYDDRTFVFASETPDGFEGIAPLTVLRAHAPEIVSDASGDWLLSVSCPENGVNAARLVWR